MKQAQAANVEPMADRPRPQPVVKQLLPGDNTVLASGERGDPTIEGGITVKIPHFTPLAATRVPFSLHTSEKPPTTSRAPHDWPVFTAPPPNGTPSS